jgi:hypothetical protein
VCSVWFTPSFQFRSSPSYSADLSERDYEAFLPLFTEFSVSARVNYGTTEQLAVRTSDNFFGNARLMTKKILGYTSAPTSPAVGAAAAAATGPNEGAAPIASSSSDSSSWWLPKYPSKAAARCVLLIDEVDVFFSDNFYGESFHLAGLVDTLEVQEVIQWVWQHKDDRPTKTPAEVLKLPAVQRIKETTPHLMPLFENEIAAMLRCAQSFPYEDAIELPDTPNGNRYLFSKNGSIQYKDPRTGSLCPWILSYWYVHSFTLCLCDRSGAGRKESNTSFFQY